MKKTRRGKKGMRHMTYVLAGILLLMQPVSVCATAPSEEESQNQAVSENTVPSDSDSQEDTVQLITEIEALSEEQSYYSYGEKPDLTQLTTDFPEELSVKTENADEYFALPVTWECEDDYEDTETDSYLFYPKWDETLYALDGETEIPFILVEIIEEDSWKMIPDIEQAKSDLHSILQAKSVMALVYLCDTYTVKAEASEDAADVALVASGQSVLIQDVALGTNGNVWYQVLFYEGEKEYKGYVERDYLITSDAEFCEWEETHIDLSRMISLMSMQSADIEQFPASYQTSLYRLKEAHPNWFFVRMDTGLDWSTVILNENKDDRNLIAASRPDSWKNGQATHGWHHATEAVLKYYMDPRNFLSDPYIFQFEQLTYNPSYHTAGAVQGILNGSFMASAIPGDSRTYAQAFEQIGKELGVSPFHLSSRVLQEQGKKGTSALISGTYSGYVGYYNYFNVGAWGSTDQDVIQNGLKKAKHYGWNTRYQSLYGGAKIIGNEYILRGQDTLYLQKFNVSNGYSPNYTHQYMQNVEAPYSESQSIRKAYNNAGVLEQMFVFKIPVYRNMPAAACSKPNTTDTLTLNKTNIDGLAVNQTQVLIPYVNGALIDDVSAVNFASSDESVAKVSGDGRVTAVSPGTATITCRRGNTTVSCTVTVVKANPSVTIPAPLPVTYSKELKISDIDLPAGWAWVQGSTALAVGTAAYEAVYTPSDTTKYNTVKKQISLTVTKAIPDYQVPEGLQANYGDELGTIALPSGFAWEDGADTKIEKTGEAVHYVSYNPDEKNYYTIDHIPVRIKVIGGGTSTSGSSSSTSTSGGSTGTGTTGGTSTSTSGSSTNTTSAGTPSGTSADTSGSSSTSTGTTSGTSTGTSGGSTSTPSSGTSTPGSSSSTSTGTTSGSSTGTSGGSTGTPSTGTPSGTSTSTSGGSTGTLNTGTPSGTSTSTLSSSTSTPSTSTTSTTSGTSTGTSSSSTSTSSSSTSTSSGSTSTGTPSRPSTGTSSSSTSTSSTSTTSGTSTSTSGSSTSTPGTGTTSGTSTSTLSSSTSTSSSSTSTLNASTSSNTGTSKTNGNINSNTNAVTTNNTDTGTTNSTDTSNNNTDTPNTNIPNSAATQNGGSTPGTPNASNVGTTAQSTGTENIGNTASPNVVASGGQPSVVREPGQIPETQFSIEEAAEEAQEQTAYAKPSVTIDMHDTTVLTGEKIEMLKEQKLDLVLDMGNQMKWTIDADTVRSEALSAVDMGVSMVKGVISQELITTVAGDRNYYEISLAHDGEFGFTAVLQIALSAEYIGRYANLFYYNPELQELQYVCSSIIDENAVAVFSFEHASDYLIIISDQPMTSGEEELPEHSDGAVKWIIGLVIILAAGAVVGSILLFCTRKKQEDTEDDDRDEDDEDDEDDEADEEYNEDDEKDLTVVHVIDIKQPKAGKQTEERKLTKKESEEPEEFDEYDGYDDSEEYDDSEDGYEHSEEYDHSEEEYDDSEENDWIDDDEWEKTQPKETALQENTSDEEDDWIDDEEWEKAYRG